jgi:hypothetical protein
MWRGVSGSTSNPRCEQLRVVIATCDGRNELQFPVSTRPMINQERFYFQYGYALPGVSFRKEKWSCLGHGLVVHCCSAGPTYGGPEQLHAVPESRRHGQHGLFGFVLHAPPV